MALRPFSSGPNLHGGSHVGIVNQKIKIALPDTGDMLHVLAQVAWSTFEKPHVADAQYRAGLEFTGAAQQALEDYRLRHCAEEPIPYRGYFASAL